MTALSVLEPAVPAATGDIFQPTLSPLSFVPSPGPSLAATTPGINSDSAQADATPGAGLIGASAAPGQDSAGPAGGTLLTVTANLSDVARMSGTQAALTL
jgi:hypothetical protein